MLIDPKTALAAVESGEATIDGLTTTDGMGYQFVILTNYEHARTDHVECATKYGDESAVELMAVALADADDE